MSPATATVAYIVLILGLFWLDRDLKSRPSAAVWVPVVWILLASSRSVSQWLAAGKPFGPISSADQYAMEGNPIDRMVYAGLLAVAVAVLIKRKSRVMTLLLASGPVLLFFTYCAVSLLWSDYPDIAFKRWIKALGDLVMVLVIVSDREPYAAIKKLLARLTFLLIPISALFIKYYPALGRGFDRWDWSTFYTGVTTNKNALGEICLFLGAASLWRFLAAYRSAPNASRNRQLLAHGILLALVFWIFRMAVSMTSLSCFLLAGVVIMATNSKFVLRKPAIISIVIGMALLVCVCVLFLGFYPGILKAIGRDPTLTSRTELWSTILPLAGDPVLGTGFESFWLGPRLQKIWSSFSWQPFEAHNGYIEIYLNLGWTGIILLLLVLGKAYKTAIAAWRRNQPASDLMLAYFVVALVYNFTEAAFFRMMAPAWIFLLLSMIITSRKLVPSDHKSFRQLPGTVGSTNARPRTRIATGEFV